MVRIRETDYHHGAFASTLVNMGYQLQLIESIEKRRVYQITRDNQSTFVYSKFASKPTSENGKSAKTWMFRFNDYEIDKIKAYCQQKACMIVFTCHYGKRDGGELVTLTSEEFFTVIGEEWRRKDVSVSVLKLPNHAIRVYGTGISRDKAFVAKTKIH